MTKHIKTPGSQAIHEARKVVREEFPDAPEWAIKRLALLMCARDGYEASLALGERLDLDALLKVDAVIEEIRAKLTKEKPHSISVSFVEGVVGSYRCSHCNQWNEIPEGQYTPAKTGRPEPAPAPHGAPVSPDTPEPRDTTANKAGPLPNACIPLDTRPSSQQKPAPLVPLMVHREGVSASKIHSQVLLGDNEVPPLKKEQPSHWRTADQAQRDPHPYRDAAGGERGGHPLPVPHGVIW